MSSTASGNVIKDKLSNLHPCKVKIENSPNNKSGGLNCSIDSLLNVDQHKLTSDSIIIPAAAALGKSCKSPVVTRDTFTSDIVKSDNNFYDSSVSHHLLTTTAAPAATCQVKKDSIQSFKLRHQLVNSSDDESTNIESGNFNFLKHGYKYLH